MLAYVVKRLLLIPITLLAIIIIKAIMDLIFVAMVRNVGRAGDRSEEKTAIQLIAIGADFCLE